MPSSSSTSIVFIITLRPEFQRDLPLPPTLDVCDLWASVPLSAMMRQVKNMLVISEQCALLRVDCVASLRRLCLIFRGLRHWPPCQFAWGALDFILEAHPTGNDVLILEGTTTHKKAA